MLPKGKAAGIPNPPLIVQGTTIKRLGIPMECGQEFGLINENKQSGWRMIARSDEIRWSPPPLRRLTCHAVVLTKAERFNVKKWGRIG
jgi:hypothetical protein